MDDSTSRRAFLAAGGAIAASTLAGCSDGGASAVDPGEIDDGTRPSLGAEDAPVTVTVFEDFGCPACRQFKRSATPVVVRQHVEPGNVRYLHADFPIPVDESWSYPVASAAHAVFQEAGNEGFWPFATTIYDHQGSYSLDAIESVAADVADAGAAARTAAEEETYRERIEADRDRGQQWGVSGTPSVFVDDEQVDPSEVMEAINARL